MTLQWFGRIAETLASGSPVLFEGQMRIAFVQEALEVHSIEGARVVCVECVDITRTGRLTNERLQPELVSESMMGWSRYLHQEAIEAGFEILNTSGLSPAESTAHILSALQTVEAE